jgi:hypothetical protein
VWFCRATAESEQATPPRSFFPNRADQLRLIQLELRATDVSHLQRPIILLFSSLSTLSHAFDPYRVSVAPSQYATVTIPRPPYPLRPCRSKHTASTSSLSASLTKQKFLLTGGVQILISSVGKIGALRTPNLLKRIMKVLKTRTSNRFVEGANALMALM